MFLSVEVSKVLDGGAGVGKVCTYIVTCEIL